MGVLYYFKREDDDELFALNKLYSYSPLWIARYREWSEPPTSDDIICDFGTKLSEWGCRVVLRLISWADGQRIKITSDQEDRDGPITGSAHDSDYEEDGVTYKPGSAW